MGCQIGRIIIVNNEGMIIFGNVGRINIKETSVSTDGSGSNITSSENGSDDNGESAQNATNASTSGAYMAQRSKRHRQKPR